MFSTLLSVMLVRSCGMHVECLRFLWYDNQDIQWYIFMALLCFDVKQNFLDGDIIEWIWFFVL